jgi:hypothetical protein
LGPEPGLDPNVFEGTEESKNPYALIGKVFTSAMAPWETGTLFENTFFVKRIDINTIFK